ncbi:TIGR02594 family protein [Pararhizobium sp.]|uniref:TIGR02594 family protein n=1 Tax=Pararhizobium sp. TaxID=1977563 RepID=UPI003D0BA559
MEFDQWLIARLKAFGFYSAASDGAHGRAVIDGLKQFQKANELKVTGTANSETVYALRKDPKAEIIIYQPVPKGSIAPVWLREAKRLKGLMEIPGPKSNPVIMGWAKKLGGWVAKFYTNDDIPWCGLFQAHLFGATLPSEILPSNPLSALAWSKFGIALTTPSLGALMTFTRPGGGHVGEYLGEDATHFHIIGGNQANSVSITRVEKKRLVATRWPATAEPPIGGRITLTAGGVLVSANEK